MIREGLHKFMFENENKHLLDIFSFKGTYLELGSIDYDVMKRLLNFELIDYEDLAYFPIQNHGLGKFEIAHDNLRRVLPFLFFERLHQKNKNLQLFITHALLQHKDDSNREIFSPIALVPVNIYFENDRIFIQQISRPIENTYLNNYLSQQRNIEISVSEKLDSVFSLDKYCFEFEKHGSLKLENYLTFAALKEPEMKLERSLFDYEGGFPDYLSDTLYDIEYPPLYYSTQLTRKQRQAVYKGESGDNIVLTGRIGTGKTTTLFNIAVNAIASGKRVLYVSNMKETLEQIYLLFEKIGLQQYLTDFTNSYASFHQGELLLSSENEMETETQSENLYQNYRFIKKYVDAMTGRILDFRFIEIINKLARIADFPKVKLEIDNLSGLYKNEYLEILSALRKIEENLKKIGNFKNSIWKEIPIFNNIKYPNQIFILIHQVQKSYLAFQEEKEILEKGFGLKTISNYAYLKSVIRDLKGLDINAFPFSWVNFENFNQAQEEFRILKSQIYQIQEMEYLLASKYEQADSFPIEAEYQMLLGPFFTKKDFEKINRLFYERAELKVIINKIAVQLNIYRKTLRKVTTFLNWDFPQTNAILEEIQNLNQIIQTTKISSEFISVVISGKFEEVSKKLLTLIYEIETAETEIATLFNKDDFGLSKDLDQDIANLERFVNNQPLKRSAYRLFVNIKKDNPDAYLALNQNLKRYRELKNTISIKAQEFKNLTGFDFEVGVYENLQKFNAYLNNLSDKVIKSKFLKFFKSTLKVTPEDSRAKRNYRNFFDLFSKAYFLLNIYYQELISYGFLEEKPEFLDKIKDIEAIESYLETLYDSFERLSEIKKGKETVSADDYFEFYKLASGISEKKEALKSNHKYRYLYGKLYEDYNTNINNISRFLQAFKLYSDCFENEEKLIESLNENTHQDLIAHLEVCEEASENLAEVFKLYFKIFKDSVSKYYYSDFESILESLLQLGNSKDELINYLGVTDNLKILSRYRLKKLIELIINLDNPENLSLNFQYTYLETIKDIYLEKHPYLAEYQVLETCLDATMNYEKEVLKTIGNKVVRKIKRQSNTKFSVYGIRNLDYAAYLRRTYGIKHLILSDTQILNNFLNPAQFDLILIDDAHLLNANDYYRALQGKQVIVAGELQLLSSVANNLISWVSNSKSIVLDFRFIPTPRNLLIHMPGIRGLTYSEYKSNFGIEVVAEMLADYVGRILTENNNSVLNVFLSDFGQQKQLYENLAKLMLAKGFEESKIIATFKKRLNICDLAYEYLFDADYNVLVLEDYYQIEVDFEVANLLDLLLLCRKKLVILDNNNLLGSDVKTRFLTEIREVINNQDVYLPKHAVGAVSVLVQKLEAVGIKVYSSSVLSLLLQKGEKFYGVLIFWAEENTDYEILNEFRENHFISKNMLETFIVWSFELMESVEKTAERILKGMKDA